jgi:Tfp pilus assembly protein PilN
VNAVNLLPTKHRPRTPTGGQQGSAYAVIGTLGVVLVMVLLYVLTSNSINTKKDTVARTNAETAQAEARARSLSAYGNFSSVKEQRVSSVKQLATGRIDWERLSRGLAHVLPPDVWLVSANASAVGSTNGSSGASNQGTGGGPPSLQLTGCAPNQSQVAVTLVRLKELSGAQDVQLNSIEQPETAGSGGAPTAAPSGGSDSGGGQDCGSTHKHINYKFDVTVQLKPNPGSGPADRKVPASLGGGS